MGPSDLPRSNSKLPKNGGHVIVGPGFTHCIKVYLKIIKVFYLRFLPNNTTEYSGRPKIAKSRKERTLKRSTLPIDTTTSEDEGPQEATKTIRRGRPNPQKPILLSGETQSEWKAKELFGVFEYYDMDQKTQRPVYKVSINLAIRFDARNVVYNSIQFIFLTRISKIAQ